MLTVSASSSHIGDGVQKRSTTETTSTSRAESNNEGLLQRPCRREAALVWVV